MSPTVTNYLSYLTTLSLSALSTTEPHYLAKSLNSNLLSLQDLSSRSHKSVIPTTKALSTLGEYLPALISSASTLRDGVPELDEKALRFSQKYSRSNAEIVVLDRRKKATLLSRNVDRVSDILELPSLLATAIASSSLATSSGSAYSVVNYSQALDLFAHIKRLQILHPDSTLVQSVLIEAEEAMKDMTSNLISSLRGQNIRLAAAIRTIGWLRRVAPELATQGQPLPSAKSGHGNTYLSIRSSTPTDFEGSFGYLFLTCRLYNLLNVLEALAPLRDLSDQETRQRLQRQSSSALSNPSIDEPGATKKASTYSHSAFTGQQTERYLKRYIEIFREQSFATVSMYKNIFPAASDSTTTNTASPSTSLPSSAPGAAPLRILTLPTPLSTFPTHLISLLTETLHQYLPNVTDPSARDSLLMQVLYAAGSLGRLGADFSLVIASLLDDGEDEEEEEEEEEDDDDEAGEEGEQYEETSGQVVEGRSARAEGVERKCDDDNNDKDAALSQSQQETGVESSSKQIQKGKDPPIPEWIRILQKHRLQSSRLEALSSGQGQGQGHGQGQGQEQSRLPLRRGSSQEAVVK